MLQSAETYREVYENFQWRIPEFYNIGIDVCDKWAEERDRLALIYEDEEGRVEKFTFWDLQGLSNCLANTLKTHGINRGDRVGILLPQCPETGLAHIAVYKLGAIAVPLFTLFGPEALEYRLDNSQAKGIITDAANVEKVLAIREKLPELEVIVQTKGDVADGVLDFWEALNKASNQLDSVSTKAEDPALLIYTSGTTGPPKGALHAHRVLLGHMPGVEFPHNFFPQKGDMFWTPADFMRISPPGPIIAIATLLPYFLTRLGAVSYTPRPTRSPAGSHFAPSRDRCRIQYSPSGGWSSRMRACMPICAICRPVRPPALASLMPPVRGDFPPTEMRSVEESM